MELRGDRNMLTSWDDRERPSISHLTANRPEGDEDKEGKCWAGGVQPRAGHVHEQQGEKLHSTIPKYRWGFCFKTQPPVTPWPCVTGCRTLKKPDDRYWGQLLAPIKQGKILSLRDACLDGRWSALPLCDLQCHCVSHRVLGVS